MNSCGGNNQTESANLSPNRLREECIITPKVYDSCRQQECLTANIIGPARAAQTCIIGDVEIPEGAVIVPPTSATGVSISDICLGNVMITEKKPSQFRNGFWDVTVKYSFNYVLTFSESDGTFIGSIKAVNVYTKRVSLFGSNDTCVQLVTDLLPGAPLSSGPHILVESKAVALSAEIDYCTRSACDYSDPIGVNVTLGLFTIIKLYRIVNLKVESRGFCVPAQCDNISPINVCEYFDDLDFPMDLFAPPQKAEFFAGISGNIPNNQDDDDSCPPKPCGCGARDDCSGGRVSDFGFGGCGCGGR